MPKLLPDSQAPAFSVPTVGGGAWTLADRSPQNFSMIVFYRGHHCPVCKGYLQALDGVIGDYRDLGVDVIAASMNPEELATQTRSEWDLGNVTLGHSVTEDQARAWDLYLSNAIRDTEQDVFCEPGVFLVRPDGRLYFIAINSMPWGRPNLVELKDKIAFALEKSYPARGTRA